MGNEYGAADLQPHLVIGTIIHKVDWGAAATYDVIGGGYHQKMRLRSVYAMVADAASTNVEATVAVHHGGRVVVAAVDIGTIVVTPAIGTVLPFTIVDQYKDLEADEALQVVVSVADNTAGSEGLFIFVYELVE